jgi:uncharacterized membrane protein
MATHVPTRPDPAVLVHEAKEPITRAAGPYGHPFHPILVTVPIGAWICSLVFDIATRVSSEGSPSLVDAAYWLIGIGIIGAALAAIFGLLDLLAIPRKTRAFAVGLTHLALNVSVLAAFVVDFVWRHSSYDESRRVEMGQLILSAVAIGVLAISGWLGGQLAYRYGVRVADEAEQQSGYR